MNIRTIKSLCPAPPAFTTRQCWESLWWENGFGIIGANILQMIFGRNNWRDKYFLHCLGTFGLIGANILYLSCSIENLSNSCDDSDEPTRRIGVFLLWSVFVFARREGEWIQPFPAKQHFPILCPCLSQHHLMFVLPSDVCRHQHLQKVDWPPQEQADQRTWGTLREGPWQPEGL